MDRGFDHAQGMTGSHADPDEHVEDVAERMVAEPKVLLIVGGGIAAYKVRPTADSRIDQASSP